MIDSEQLAFLKTIARAEAAEAEVARLREALEPFVRYADAIEELNLPGGAPVGYNPKRCNPEITVADFRRARAALASKEEGGR